MDLNVIYILKCYIIVNGCTITTVQVVKVHSKWTATLQIGILDLGTNENFQ